MRRRLQWGFVGSFEIHRLAMFPVSSGFYRTVAWVIMPSPKTPPERGLTMWEGYQSPGCWDELLLDGHPRHACEGVVRYLMSLGGELAGRQEAAELAIRSMGITFTVYTEASQHRPGLALRRHPAGDLDPGVGDESRAASSSGSPPSTFSSTTSTAPPGSWPMACSRPSCCPRRSTSARSARVPNRPRECGPTSAAATSCATPDGTMYVLEDNLRVPSGVSYMLENRQVTKRVFADLFRDLDIQPFDDYPNKLAGLLAALSPRPGETPVIAVLTPGIFNSAYFEHAFLAQQMGAHLVEGKDLVVDGDDCVYMRTIGGLVRVDVIYRRVDDLFLDPEVFRPDSARRRPRAHAGLAGRATSPSPTRPGAGVADDKVVYAYVPALIRYYLDEDPLIPNVPTWLCHRRDERSHVLAHLDEMVVKPANESGGYGVFVGSMATEAAKDEMRRRVEADPRDYIAQPIVRFPPPRRCVSGRVVPRHLDLRPFILSGEQPYVTQGGLTRVALKEGPWSSTAPRAAAARTPGSSTPPSCRHRASPRSSEPVVTESHHVAVAGRRVGLLGRALPRAGRGHGPVRARPHRALPGPAEGRRRRLGAAVGGDRERSRLSTTATPGPARRKSSTSSPPAPSTRGRSSPPSPRPTPTYG